MQEDLFVTLASGARILKLEEWLKFHQPLLGQPYLGGAPLTEQQIAQMWNVFVDGLNRPPVAKKVSEH